jgi:hypothetical protein
MPVIRAVLAYGSVHPNIAAIPPCVSSETAGASTALASWPASVERLKRRPAHTSPANTHRRAGSATSARFYILILYMNDVAPKQAYPDECAERRANDSPSSRALALG